ncbi:MAG: response regulator [Candidatus Omnitrophica bacterium]|nr:response regulator [Candidatus Omnitrophota bacterium]
MKKILVIDDEINFAQMIKINLEATQKYEVDTANNAMEGYEKIKINTYDVIFLDVLMPKIEGHVALGEIKKLCNTPVVVISAYMAPQQKSTIIRLGAFACLEKPIDLQTIEAAISAIAEQA